MEFLKSIFDHVWSKYDDVKVGMIMSGPGMIM